MVVIVLTRAGLPLARRIAALFPGAEVHGLEGRVPSADACFAAIGPHVQGLFRSGRSIIGLCAAGILIRSLAPLLRDKEAEPPVLAVAEDGSAVVPLLGGHRGANRLAARIGELLEVPAAITTAGDHRLGTALDDPPAGWRLANPEHYKDFAAALLDGHPVRVEGHAPWLDAAKLTQSERAEHLIRITESNVKGAIDELVYHPAVLSVGVGCERGVDQEELANLVRRTLNDHRLAESAVAGVFSVDLKADEDAVHGVGQILDVPVRFFSAGDLEAETPRLANPSERVFREVGCHGVAEGAALAAARPFGDLIVAKQKSRRATCAVARAPTILDPRHIGNARGSLAVVGIGPGDAQWRTPEATAAIEAASDLVGYSLYLELLGPLAQGKTLHSYDLGQEETRVSASLALAARGRAVALVCSGDAGIYAMASLVFELLERHQDPAWNRVAITVLPGISALQAAAARIGAPLGHDFCAISLSDLLTPWSVIERRLRAAADGDFVVALYNPVSRRRTRQLRVAVDVLRARRSPDTPVVLARNLGRDAERVTVVNLDALEPERVDMLTVVLVGSSETRRLMRTNGECWVYTPRGYAAKHDVDPEAAA